jgi:hypothetical protein
MLTLRVDQQRACSVVLIPTSLYTGFPLGTEALSGMPEAFTRVSPGRCERHQCQHVAVCNDDAPTWHPPVLLCASSSCSELDSWLRRGAFSFSVNKDEYGERLSGSSLTSSSSERSSEVSEVYRSLVSGGVTILRFPTVSRRSSATQYGSSSSESAPSGL